MCLKETLDNGGRVINSGGLHGQPHDAVHRLVWVVEVRTERRRLREGLHCACRGMMR